MHAPWSGGVLVVDKPRGPTSHDVVYRLRRALGTKAIGHAGTLDPMATGVLVAAIGDATKLVPWLTAHDKSYRATLALGVETDTLDAEGKEVRRGDLSAELRAALRPSDAPMTSEILRAAFERERARTSQIPPAYSAIRSGGERAFDLARRGESPELAPRPVAVRRLELVACRADPPLLELEVDVGKGYYVRALARDLAEALGTFGHLTQLRRTGSGCFVAEEATPLDATAEVLRGRIVPLDQAAARALPVARLTDAGVRDARHGRPVQPEDVDAGAASPDRPGLGAPCAWLDAEGALVAVGQIEQDGRGRVLRGFGGQPPPGG
jgi:tRNA pseudouridine55 synthase